MKQAPSGADGGWRPIERSRAHELVVGRIEEQIAAGGLGVGDRLPAERDLASMLGVSRAAVREAIRTLEALGVVRATGGAGRESASVLSSMPSEALAQLLRLHIGLANFPMDDIIEARVMLERWSARLTAVNATDEQLAGLTGLVDRMAQPDIPRERFNDLDTAFHVAVAEAGGNRLVADLTTAIRASMATSILKAFRGRDDWAEVHSVLCVGHARILEALVLRDPQRAADAIEEHVRLSFAQLGWGRPRA